MVPDEGELRRLYQDMNDHDKLTELCVKMDMVQVQLGGNGGPGLCERVDNLENTTERHGIYFQILIAFVTVAVTVGTYIGDRIFNR